MQLCSPPLPSPLSWGTAGYIDLHHQEVISKVGGQEQEPAPTARQLSKPPLQWLASHLCFKCFKSERHRYTEQLV